ARLPRGRGERLQYRVRPLVQQRRGEPAQTGAYQLPRRQPAGGTPRRDRSDRRASPHRVLGGDIRAADGAPDRFLDGVEDSASWWHAAREWRGLVRLVMPPHGSSPDVTRSAVSSVLMAAAVCMPAAAARMAACPRVVRSPAA